MMHCPSCAHAHEPCLVCPSCGAPQPVDLDCFAALDLPRRLLIDPEKIEHSYHELGRRIHPDRFASSPASVRSASLSGTALLTRSYRTLRDPVSRGLYWLELQGDKLGQNNKQVPADLAALVFEVQEELSDLRSVSSDGGEAAANPLRDGIVQRRDELQASMDETIEELFRNFAIWDEHDADLQDKAELRTKLIADLKRVLSKIAYLRTLIRDVDRELENAAQP